MSFEQGLSLDCGIGFESVPRLKILSRFGKTRQFSREKQCTVFCVAPRVWVRDSENLLVLLRKPDQSLRYYVQYITLLDPNLSSGSRRRTVAINFTMGPVSCLHLNPWMSISMTRTQLLLLSISNLQLLVQVHV